MDTMKSWKVQGFGILVAFGEYQTLIMGCQKKVKIPKRGTFLLKVVLYGILVVMVTEETEAIYRILIC